MVQIRINLTLFQNSWFLYKISDYNLLLTKLY